LSKKLTEKPEPLTWGFALLGQTEAVVQQLQRHWAVVRAGQATLG